MLQEYGNQINITEQVLLEAAYNPFQGKDMLALLLNEQGVEIKITPAVVKAAATSWLESEEMLELLNQRKVDFQMLSTTLISQGPRSGNDLLQRALCPKMNETSMETTKLLLNQFDPECTLREDILLSSVGDSAVKLMLQLIDESPIAFRDDGGFQADIGLMQERGITSQGLAFCLSHNPFCIIVLHGYCEATQEVFSVPGRALVAAASNEEEGHLIIPEILRDIDSWSQDRKLVISMVRAAATGGQDKLLDFIFKRCGIEDSETRANTFAIASLYNAVKQNDEETVIRILADGTRPDTVNFRGRTPLWQACVRGHTSVVHVLLGTRAVEIERTDDWKRTGLHWAAALNHSDVVKLLLKHGADPGREDRMGLTPLKLARRWKAQATETLLQDLEKGERLEEIWDADGESGEWTALHFAARSGREGVLQGLLDHGSDMNKPTGRQTTPLHIAAQEGHDRMVKMLLEHGADVEAQDEDQRTALHIAAWGGHERVVKTLLDGGADVDAQDENKWTLLHVAARGGDEGLMRMLLEGGAEVDVVDGDGWTPLHSATAEGQLGTVSALLSAGANAHTKTPQGHSVLHLASAIGHHEIAAAALEKRCRFVRTGQPGLDCTTSRSTSGPYLHVDATPPTRHPD